MQTFWRAGAVAVAAAAALGIALAVSGLFGLVVVGECLAVLALVIALATTPRSVRERPAFRWPGWAGAWARLTRGRIVPRAARKPAVHASDFPTYTKISSDLGWAPVSQWHYDHGLRPLLIRLLDSGLEERHRTNAATDPVRARRLLGDDAWPFVDPLRPPSFDSKSPGPDLRTVSRIVDRLEQL
jgi:hypothetical protein